MKNVKDLQNDVKALEVKLKDFSEQRLAVDIDQAKITKQLGELMFEGRKDDALENELAKCQNRAAALEAGIKHGQGELAKAKAELFEAEKSEARRSALDELGTMESELSGLLQAIATTAGKMQNWGERLMAIDALAKRYRLTEVHELFSIVYSSIPFEQLRGISQDMARNQVYGRIKKQ